jgi:hypothetical protein
MRSLLSYVELTSPYLILYKYNNSGLEKQSCHVY